MKPFKLLAFTLALCSCGQGAEESLIDETLAPYAVIEDGIQLADGRLLNFVCMGQGSPTIILTAGLGDFSGPAWSQVQADMAKLTRVCAWDRPGFGLSDGSASPQDVTTTTADLEEALATGKIPGPYVMIGHSHGALESLLFADHRPADVVGMVLIDPSFPGQFSDPPDPSLYTLRMTCAAEIRSGKLRPGSEDPDGCVAFPLLFPPMLSDALKEKVLANPLQYESQASFNRNGTRSSELAVNPARDYGAMPLIVLTAQWERPWLFRLMPDSITDEVAADKVRMDRGHQELAELSTGGIHQRVPDPNHYLQRTAPEVVIAAASSVVGKARELENARDN